MKEYSTGWLTDFKSCQHRWMITYRIWAQMPSINSLGEHLNTSALIEVLTTGSSPRRMGDFDREVTYSRRCLPLATDQWVSCVTLQMLRVSWAALSLSSPRHFTSDSDLHKFCSSTVKMLLLYFPEKSLEPQENLSLIVQLPAEGAVGNGGLKRLHISFAPLFTKILM